jgi:ADP-ribose pyrophosphatase
MIKKPQFNCNDVEVLGRETLYQRFFRVEKISLRHKLFKGGWSKSINREIFLRGNAVAVVLYDPVNDLIGVIEQFRIGAMDEVNGPWCYEVVAGMVEDGEEPEAVARRELLEEANVTPYHIEFICDFLSSPGGSDEKLFLYCALSDLTGAGGVHGLTDENEDIHLHCFAAEEVFAELLKGSFNNAAALICLQWLQMNRERLRKIHGPE